MCCHLLGAVRVHINSKSRPPFCSTLAHSIHGRIARFLIPQHSLAALFRSVVSNFPRPFVENSDAPATVTNGSEVFNYRLRAAAEQQHTSHLTNMSSETESQQAATCTSRLLSLPPELFLLIVAELGRGDSATLIACSRTLTQAYVPLLATFIDEVGENLLVGAISMKYHALARALLEHGADPNAADHPLKSTSLNVAAFLGDVVATRLLLEFGADLNLADEEQRLPLHCAAAIGSAELIELLADAGASLDVMEKYGDTPLHVASMLGHIDAVRMLLSKGADVDTVRPWLAGEEGMSAILDAVSNGHVEVVKALLEAGASSCLTDAVLGAGHLGNVAVMKVMVESGREDIRMIASLLLLKAMEEDGETQESTEIVQVLLDAGIVVDNTTLELATHRPVASRKCTEMLRRYNADLAVPSVQ
jgi:ankyrin repeat protein